MKLTFPFLLILVLIASCTSTEKKSTKSNNDLCGCLEYSIPRLREINEVFKTGDLQAIRGKHREVMTDPTMRKCKTMLQSILRKKKKKMEQSNEISPDEDDISSMRKVLKALDPKCEHIPIYLNEMNDLVEAQNKMEK
jgi:NAD(P)H-nitrite reductase large subunit